MFRPAIEAARTGGRSVVVEAALRDPVFVRDNVGGPFAARIAADPAFREEVLGPSPEAYQKVLIDYDGNIFGRDVPFVSRVIYSDLPASAVHHPRHRCVSPGRDFAANLRRSSGRNLPRTGLPRAAEARRNQAPPAGVLPQTRPLNLREFSGSSG